jgi:hypothetical protein
MTHDELIGEAAKICRDFAVTIQYWPDSRRAWSRGWPDLVLAGAALLFREIKTQDDNLDQEQWDWGERLTVAAQDWKVWRPRDFVSGLVRREIAGIAIP